jgi:hypothetical protein
MKLIINVCVDRTNTFRPSCVGISFDQESCISSDFHLVGITMRFNLIRGRSEATIVVSNPTQGMDV